MKIFEEDEDALDTLAFVPAVRRSIVILDFAQTLRLFSRIHEDACLNSPIASLVGRTYDVLLMSDNG